MLLIWKSYISNLMRIGMLRADFFALEKATFLVVKKKEDEPETANARFTSLDRTSALI